MAIPDASKNDVTVEWAAAEWVAVDSLVPWERNPRKNEGLPVEKVVESIKHFGFGAPVLARKANREVIAGHTRLKAAKVVGMTHVPVRWMDLDEVDAHALALADNRSAQESSWDDVLLNQLMLEMSRAGVDMAKTSFDDDEVKRRVAMAQAQALAGVEEDEDDPLPLPAEPRSRPGEVYELGPHRLMCGDATVQTDVEKLVDGQAMDGVWTDPPYGVSYVGKTKDALTIKNDKLGDGQLEEFLTDAFTSAFTVCRPGAAWYVAAPAGPQFLAFAAPLKRLEVWRQTLVWVKDSLVLGHSDYHYRHEAIFYGWKPGQSHHATPDRKQDTIWEVPRPKRSKEHPTMKPIELIERALKNSTDAGDRVLDPFGGSGSTLIAAAKTGRMAYLLELDPRYCDVIRTRWDKFVNVAKNGTDTAG